MEEERKVKTDAQAMLDLAIPTIGRIVIYRPTDEQRGEWKATGACNWHLPELPAIVTCVHDAMKGYVNLRVFRDGASDAWITSVYPGVVPGTWSWPPRK